MHLMTRQQRLIAILFFCVLLISVGVWSVWAQDGVLPLPGGSGNRAFTEVQQLTASDGADAEYFGLQVALDGDTLLEGNSPADSIGAAYIFERDNNGDWNEIKRLIGSDSALEDDFAYDVALDGDTAVVGAPGHTSMSDDEGAIYVFTPNGAGVWTQSQKLTVPAAPMNSYLGNEVDIDGDRIIAAAEGIDKAYIFKRNTNQVWQLEADLDTGQEVYDVKIQGDIALIGAASDNGNIGTVHVYQLQAGSWTFVKKLTPSDGIPGDNFGAKLLLHNDQAFVFAYLSVPPGNFRGAVYVFSRNGGTWTQTQKLVPNDPADNDVFGYGMAADDQTLVISSYRDNADAGSVYQFGWNGSAWVQQDKILPVGNRFGIDVDFQDGVLASGAPAADNGKGRVYIYSDPNLIPTPTPTTAPAIELLTDGGFENNATGWTVKNATGDKVKCNKPTKTFAYSGNCAWRFKGGPGENAKIQQIITSGVTSGDVLKLGGYVNAGGAVSGKLKLVVTYADGVTPKGKLTINLTSPTSGYVPLSSLQPALTVNVAAPVEKIKLMVTNSSTSGKVYYDALSLTAQ